MKRILRAFLVASTLAVPFAVAGPSAPASATCRPERPQTCEMYCPSGEWVTAGPVRVCMAVSDDVDIYVPELPPRP